MQIETEPAAGSSRPGELPGGVFRGLAHWGWLALFALAFWPSAEWLWHRWTLSIWQNGHGLFIPFIVAYLCYDSFKTRPLPDSRGSALGFPFVITGLAMLVIDAAIRTDLLAAAGLVVCLPGLSLLIWGTRRTRALLFPLAIAPFMLPIPAAFVSSLHLVLRQVTAVGTKFWVELIGIPILRDGTMLHIPSGPIEVADVCSGFSTLYAAVTLSLILAYLARENARRIVILVGAWVLAILCNSIRVTSLVVMAHTQGPEMLDTYAHELSGVLSFSITLVLLFALAGRATFRATPA